MNERPDYGPAGCCQGTALGVITGLTSLCWGVVFLVVQVARWVL